MVEERTLTGGRTKSPRKIAKDRIADYKKLRIKQLVEKSRMKVSRGVPQCTSEYHG